MINAVGLVFSRSGIGPKGGGRHGGRPLSIGPIRTRFERHDGIEMSLPNIDLVLWDGPFVMAAHHYGVRTLHEQPGWEWLKWTLAEHVAADRRHSENGRGNHHSNDQRKPRHEDDRHEPLVIVPCGARKQDHAAPAENFYTGSYHRLCLRTARALTSPDNIRILSGKYGFLSLDDVVEPYEMRLGAPGSISVEQLTEQARLDGTIERRGVVALAGRNYARHVTSVWPHAQVPLAGSRGIGDQQRRLVAMCDASRLSALRVSAAAARA